MKVKRALLHAATALVTVLISPTQAALIAQQEYNGLTFGFNATNNPFAFQTGTVGAGLTYPNLIVSGSSRTFSNSPQATFAGGALSDTGQFFFSFLINNNGNVGSPTTEARIGLTLFASNSLDGNGGGTGTEVVEFGQRFGKINLIRGNYGPPGTFQDFPSPIAATTGTHLFVIGLTTNASADTANLSFYYDPTSSVPGTPLLTYTAPAFHTEIIRALGNSTWDEFRVGTTFADVTPGLPVPEPSTFALLGIGLGLFLSRRRSRVS